MARKVKAAEASSTGEDAAELVELLKPHQHQGQDYPPGARVSVRPPIAAWLRTQGVIAPRPEDPA